MPGTNLQVERSTLAIIVVSFDVAIVLSFLLSFYCLAYFEKVDSKEQDTLTIEDFSIVIKTLPSTNAYNTIAELKAALWNHLERIVKD